MSTASVSFKGSDIRSAVGYVLAAELDPGKEYELTIKEKKKKRSRDANSYFWEFLDQLAVRL